MKEKDNVLKRILLLIVYALASLIGYFSVYLVFESIFGKIEIWWLFPGLILFFFTFLLVYMGGIISGKVTFMELKEMLRESSRQAIEILLFGFGLLSTHILILLSLIAIAKYLLGDTDIRIDSVCIFFPVYIVVLGLSLYAIKSIYKLEGNYLSIYKESWKIGYKKFKASLN